MYSACCASPTAAADQECRASEDMNNTERTDRRAQLAGAAQNDPAP